MNRILFIVIICAIICGYQSSSHREATASLAEIDSLRNTNSNDTALIISILRNAEAAIHTVPTKDMSEKYHNSLKSYGYKFDGKKCEEDFDERMYGTYVYCKHCHVNKNDSIDNMDRNGSMIGFLSYGFGPAVIYETADKKVCDAILAELLKDNFMVEETGEKSSQYIQKGEKEYTCLQYLVEDDRSPAIFSILISRKAK